MIAGIRMEPIRDTQLAGSGVLPLARLWRIGDNWPVESIRLLMQSVMEGKRLYSPLTSIRLTPWRVMLIGNANDRSLELICELRSVTTMISTYRQRFKSVTFHPDGSWLAYATKVGPGKPAKIHREGFFALSNGKHFIPKVRRAVTADMIALFGRENDTPVDMDVGVVHFT